MIDMQSLKALFDDDVLVQKYIVRFIEDMPGLLQVMRNACENNHWDELSIHAHSYKSQLLYINETDAAEIAFDIEKSSAVPSPEQERIRQLIQILEDHLVRILPTMQQLIE